MASEKNKKLDQNFVTISKEQRVPQVSVNVTQKPTLYAAVVEGVPFIIKRKPVHSADIPPQRREAITGAKKANAERQQFEKDALFEGVLDDKVPHIIKVMFEQFKKLSSAISFKDLIDTTGLNEGEFKNFTREGLQVVRSEWENIRTKSAEILTPALSPRIGALSPRLPTIGSSSKSRAITRLDIPATTELAIRYENELNVIKTANENNFRNSALIDELVQQMLKKCENHYQTCELVKSETSQLPKVKEVIDEMTYSARKLTELEKMIDDYAKMNEEKSFEDWKKSELLALNKHFEEKNAELDEKKIMYQQHYEEFKDNHTSEKVQSYQADFEIQMENYRKRIITTTVLCNEHSTNISDEDLIASLEQVELETEDDREATLLQGPNIYLTSNS
ncbi:16382_t:CDS:10 [Funneliformis mosseae]|uniref:16382_t:CDS:1 n=1 Tax=Funneliformis mosseae TaxID=27381 RepID=A0A9N9G443_FUNMO|nr:16382_t:CDS:10 [Funneliformis mosseae]